MSGWQRVTFEEIKYPTSKRYRCTECGKRKGKATTFCQTLNPFNKNAAGEVKNRREILGELAAEAKVWRAVEVGTCNPCWDGLTRERRLDLAREQREMLALATAALAAVTE